MTTAGNSPASHRWTVLRYDDHGRRFVVATGLSCDEAELLVAEYERRGHERTYCAERSSVESTS